MGNKSSLPSPIGYTSKESDQIRQKILSEHNRIRSLHDAPSISYDDQMNKSAQEAANSMATKEKLETSNSSYGEILYSCSGTGVKAENVVNHFYSNGRGGSNPQLSQMLSHSSRKLGCGISRSKRGTLFLCLLYQGEPVAETQSNITLLYGDETKDSNENSLPKKSLNEMRAEILVDHNAYRAKHKSPPLKFDESLNKAAQSFAEKLARNDKLEHSSEAKDGKYGENVYCATNLPATGATKSWYKEIEDYDFVKGTFSGNTGHFTALLWKGSTHIGVGIATSKKGTHYVVANYSPPGNVRGHFIENVLKS